LTTPQKKIMHRISSLILRIPSPSHGPYVKFIVDGEDLGQRIKTSLGAEGFDDALPWEGSDFGLEDTVLGEPFIREGGKQAILLACGCGHYACSGIFANVTVTAETVTWSHFATWRHGREIIAPIAPVTFDRSQFEQAIAEVHRQAAQWRPVNQSAGPFAED
jgi:hypothetical protein